MRFQQGNTDVDVLEQIRTGQQDSVISITVSGGVIFVLTKNMVYLF